MNKFAAITLAALVGLIVVVSVAQASGYGGGYGGMQGGYGGGYSAPSYGQNYERKTGFKTVIYHPYGGVSNRFDYRTFPAYSGGYGGGYNS